MKKPNGGAKLFGVYAGISALASILDISILYLLTTKANFHYFFSAIVGYTGGSFVNYSLNRKYNFRHKGGIITRFPIFIAIAFIGLMINQAFLFTFVEFFGLYFITAKLLSAPFSLTWNFYGHKNVTFKKIVEIRKTRKDKNKLKKTK